MKKFIRGAAVAGAAGALALGVAAPAQADEQSYIDDINQGIGAVEANRGDWLALGYAACDIGNLEDATTYIYNNTGGNVDVGKAQFAAESAFMFLC